MLEFDGHALDPAIVSAQPMKSGQTVDLQQIGCPASELCSDSHYSDKIPTLFFFRVWSHYHCNSFFLQVSLTESRLPQTSAVSGQESTQVSKIRKLTTGLSWLAQTCLFIKQQVQPWGKWRRRRCVTVVLGTFNLPFPVLLQRFSLEVFILFLYIESWHFSPPPSGI